ncbi:Methyltransferase domain-containing protein [Halopelagius inordinatus]|uniref:Methyltransferase domain-containing protein n=1 Tax=Halopelagius inordinatus TaxID=553467 RepID=A0A1I2RSJ1_9EURY|nr:class I SAM-dependent methyltransferase [Halopelagius inordinatus]SFG40791.1 Methyltransferase domain-containing protein [Halopelagius inordinatus]
MTPSRPRPPAFADACEAVLADPDGEHSLCTTLAPLYARMRAGDDDTHDAHRHVLDARLPADVSNVLELGCGVGELLARLSARYDAVGVDEHPALLSFAALRSLDVVLGDPARLPFGGRFDAVCAFDYRFAHVPLADFCAAARESLRPGGILVFDAPSDARAAESSGVETFRDARYQLERAVDVAPDPLVVRADYRVTDRRTGATATTTERTRVRTYDPGSVRTVLRDAGFGDVEVSADVGGDGAFVASAVRPVETGE